MALNVHQLQSTPNADHMTVGHCNGHNVSCKVVFLKHHCKVEWSLNKEVSKRGLPVCIFTIYPSQYEEPALR